MKKLEVCFFNNLCQNCVFSVGVEKLVTLNTTQMIRSGLSYRRNWFTVEPFDQKRETKKKLLGKKIK